MNVWKGSSSRQDTVSHSIPWIDHLSYESGNDHEYDQDIIIVPRIVVHHGNLAGYIVFGRCEIRTIQFVLTYCHVQTCQ